MATKTTKTTKPTMDQLLDDSPIKPLATGDSVEGRIISIKKHEVWIDLGPNGLGVVLRREMGRGGRIEVGQNIVASVVEPELESGEALLSLRRAAKDRGWEELQKLMDDQVVVEAAAYDANRGGLLIEIEGIRGFLPVSQLAPGHYPRVSGADKDEILQKLNELLGRPLRLRILDLNRKENKLIFSEKEAIKGEMEKRFAKLKIGDTVDGLITGVIDFGAFVNVDGIEGLIHISEISWERVEDPRHYLKVGDNVQSKIIAIDKARLSLSLKQMTEDPWLGEIKAFKKGGSVEGKVTRITPFGAFVQLSPSVEALVHVSEMSKTSSADPEQLFQLNEKKMFKVLDIDKDGRKIALSLETETASPKAAKSN